MMNGRECKKKNKNKKKTQMKFYVKLQTDNYINNKGG